MTNTQCVCFDPESLDTKLGNITEELGLAFRWNRPSLVFAIYSTNAIRKLAQKKLAAELVNGGFDQVMYQVKYDVSNEFPGLIDHLSGSNSVLSIDPADGNTTADQVNKLIEVLDINKGLLINNAIKMVIWLTQEESTLFAHLAPDMWASRHRVIELEEDPADAAPQIINPVMQAAATPVQEFAAHNDFENEQEGYLNLADHINAIDPEVESFIGQAVVAWQNNDSDGIASALNNACKISQASASKATKLVCLKAKKFFAHHRGAYAEEVDIDTKIAGLEQGGNQPQTVIVNSNTSASPIADLENAVSSQPNNGAAVETLAKAYELNGETEKAISMYRRLVKLAGSDTEEQRVWSILGKLYSKMNGVDQAIAAFAIASSYNGESKVDMSNLNAGMWTEIGNLMLRSQDMKQAEAAYMQAISMDSNNASAYSNLGILYSMMGFGDKAIENMKKGADLFGTAEQKRAALNLVGDQYRLSGNYNEAIRAYETADAVTANEVVSPKNTLFTNNLFSSNVQARNS